MHLLFFNERINFQFYYKANYCYSVISIDLIREFFFFKRNFDN